MTERENFKVAEWPMTLGRIRHFFARWSGQPRHAVPFSLHAIKFLMAIIDGKIEPPEEPSDAPWVKSPDRHEEYSAWLEAWLKHGPPPDPEVYTEQDRVLHDTIEKTGPIKEPDDGEYGRLDYDADRDNRVEDDPYAGMF